MTTAIIGTGGSDRSSPASSPQAARPCGSPAPTLNRHGRWRHRSVALRSSPPATGTRCRAPMPSSSRCGLPC
jgi:hypothetical protein